MAGNQSGYLSTEDFLWLMGSLCRLHGLPFDPVLLLGQHPPPHDTDTLLRALDELGLAARETSLGPKRPGKLLPPFVAFLRSDPGAAGPAAVAGETARPALVTAALIVKADADRFLFFRPGAENPETLSAAEFLDRFEPRVLTVARKPETDGELADPGDAAYARKPFGFAWFVPELMKHKRIWRDVLLASLAIRSVRWCRRAPS
jgi:subfamily B ATP-binding cassette protein HlyB/CyaB